MKRSNIVMSMIAMGAVAAACDAERAPEQAEQAEAEEEAAEQAAAQPAEESPSQERAEEVEDLEAEELAEEAEEAKELVQEATNVLNQMKTNTEVQSLLKSAKGVFIVPDYGRGAVGVGVRGGDGLLLVRQGDNGSWSAPIFYELGGISLGAQLGGEGGDIAMLLMSDEAIQTFRGDDTFTINADAKLTLVDFSALTEAVVGKNKDVVFWSDTEGAFAGVALGVTDIDWDEEGNPAYHGMKVTQAQQFSGEGELKPSGELSQALSGL